MTDYKIISESDLSELARRVKDYLTSGWKLAGGVAIDRAGTVVTYNQAIYY